MGDAGLILGLGRSLEENVNPFQCFCLGNPTQRSVSRLYIVYGVLKGVRYDLETKTAISYLVIVGSILFYINTLNT